MKFAVSSYSLSSLVSKGEATEKELISIAKDLGFDGIEFAEIHTPEEMSKIEYAKELKAECEKIGIVPVQYSEYCDSFLNFYPTLAVVLNVEAAPVIREETADRAGRAVFAVLGLAFLCAGGMVALIVAKDRI